MRTWSLLSLDTLLYHITRLCCGAMPEDQTATTDKLSEQHSTKAIVVVRPRDQSKHRKRAKDLCQIG
jgi:hypothetical protein